MKIENYAIVRVRCKYGFPRIIDLAVANVNENSEESSLMVAVIGEIYGKEGYADGVRLLTSPIKEFTDDGKVITNSGTIYELGTKHPDYIAFEKTVSEGVPSTGGAAGLNLGLVKELGIA